MSEQDKTRMYSGNNSTGSAGTGGGNLSYEGGPASADRTRILNTGPVSFAWLAIMSGPQAGRLFQLSTTAATTLGRDYTCEIVVDDTSVSRQHAKIRVEKGEGKDGKFIYRLFDLASENGTTLNGELAAGLPMNDGDVVMLGTTRMVFKQV